MPSSTNLIITALLLMIFYNLVANKVLKEKRQLVLALAMTLLVMWFGIEQFDLSWVQMGFSRPISGLLYGTVAALTLGVVLSAAAKYKKTRKFFEDTRIIDVELRQLLKKTLIHIPLTTVLIEEVLFRGLVLGYLLNQTDQWSAIIAASLLFGIWHVIPAYKFALTNQKAKGHPVYSILGTVIFTTLTGIFLGWLRVASGSILAPMVVHFTSNSGSFALSWLGQNVFKKAD